MAPSDQLAYKPLDTASKKLDTPKVQQKDYNITKSEWSSSNREFVNASGGYSLVGTQLGSSVTIFTVPKNKTLFITSAFYSSQISIVDGTTTGAYAIQINEPLTRIYLQEKDLDALGSWSFSDTFTAPLKVAPGSRVIILGLQVGGVGKMEVSAGFSGYLETF